MINKFIYHFREKLQSKYLNSSLSVNLTLIQRVIFFYKFSKCERTYAPPYVITTFNYQTNIFIIVSNGLQIFFLSFYQCTAIYSL